jgi:hypothetical protein
VYSLNLSTSQGGVDVARQHTRRPKNAPAAKDAPKPRQIHKVGEVNISAYFPAEVKASLRMVQAKTGYNVKDCLAEALRDLFRKHKVPVAVELDGGR